MAGPRFFLSLDRKSFRFLITFAFSLFALPTDAMFALVDESGLCSPVLDR
jgi:hypothetical protein